MAVSEDFARLTDPFRAELLAHCYRMLGSVHDAEDQLQETMIRAWRSYGEFEGRASLRTWLYRIATNACLRALENSSRRPLPSGLGGPNEYPEAPLAAARPEVPWLQPIPDALVSAGSADPAEIVASRQSMRLALIAALQYLPARQRAVLILRDVLAWPAAEVAALLDTTAPAVNSLLQRARERLERVGPVEDGLAEPAEPAVRELLDRYAAAFAAHVFRGPGDIVMVPTVANGQPAAVTYRRDGPGAPHHAHSVQVLSVRNGVITHAVSFRDPALVPVFGLPRQLDS